MGEFLICGEASFGMSEKIFWAATSELFRDLFSDIFPLYIDFSLDKKTRYVTMWKTFVLYIERKIPR
jgi:hypothetical protein